MRDGRSDADRECESALYVDIRIERWKTIDYESCVLRRDFSEFTSGRFLCDVLQALKRQTF